MIVATASVRSASSFLVKRTRTSQYVSSDTWPLVTCVTASVHASAARGVNCTAEQVLILSGVQEALDLVARLFLDPGDRACVENPGYGGAARVLEAYGVRVAPVPVDDEGMTIPDGRLRDVRIAYVTPGGPIRLDCRTMAALGCAVASVGDSGWECM